MVIIPLLITAILMNAMPVQESELQARRKSARERQEAANRLRYDSCLDLIEKSADRAIDKALAWQAEQPGSVLARHCEALALVKDGEYAAGAKRLNLLAADMERGRGLPRNSDQRTSIDPVFIADVWAQAANAWLLGDELTNAEDAIDRALTMVDTESVRAAPFMVDRAYIAARVGDFELAYNDLQSVLKADPGRRDILILLASAARRLGYLDEAETNIGIYVTSFPTDPTGFLEFGNLRDLQGRRDEARKAWLKVLELEEEGPNATAAQANLQRLALAK